MNCFEWHYQSVDLLEGRLPASGKKKLDEHLKSCASCSDRLAHYQVIVESVASMKMSRLPESLQKEPLKASLPKIDSHGRSRWQRLPWFVRTGIEGAGVAAAVLIVVALVPQIRSLYERNMQKRLDALILAESVPLTAPDTQTEEEHAPLARGYAGSNPVQGEEEHQEEFLGEGVEGGELLDHGGSGDGREVSGPNQIPQVFVGNSETWRFNLKTDSPGDLRKKVITILGEIDVPRDARGASGVAVPGGIQFDVLVDKDQVGRLKYELEQLVEPLGQAPDKADQNERSVSSRNRARFRNAFFWYRNKARRRIPRGKTRTVIWLQQI